MNLQSTQEIIGTSILEQTMKKYMAIIATAADFLKPYSLDEWEKKVRKLKLDPRPPSEKVRGFSKKGIKKITPLFLLFPLLKLSFSRLSLF